MDLKHSKVSRGGVTSRYWYGSTTNIRTGDVGDGLTIRFSLPSKGGGYTDVAVVIGRDDLKRLLPGVARRNPQIAPSLAAATHIASKSLLRMLPKDSK